MPPPALRAKDKMAATETEAAATTAAMAADASSPSAGGGGAPKDQPCWQIASAPVGAVYEGELSIRGVAAGRGKLTFANGDVYEG